MSSMNGESVLQEDPLRQARLATEALAGDMARSIIEMSSNEGENQVNFITTHLTRLLVTLAELRAVNAMLRERLAESVPSDVEVVT